MNTDMILEEYIIMSLLILAFAKIADMLSSLLYRSSAFFDYLIIIREGYRFSILCTLVT